MTNPSVYNSSVFIIKLLKEGDSTILDPCETGEEVVVVTFVPIVAVVVGFVSSEL
jgi:hypothetical protein